VTDLPPGFTLDDEKPVKRSPAEDKLAVLAKLSPAEQARSDEFERSPANIRQAKTELAREKDPEARRVIQEEIDRQERAGADAPPEGFTVDELPPGFKIDAPAPAKPLTGAAAVPQDPAAAARVAAEAKARQIVEQRGATQRAANPIVSRAVGAAEAGLEVATRLLGGSIGGLAGIFGINTEQGGDKGFTEGAQRGIQGVRDALQMVGVTSGKPMSQTGQEYTEAAMEPIEKVGQVLPPTAGVFGTLAGPATAAPVAAQRGAVRAGAGKVADAALEAATPRLSESTMKRAQAATEAGIPISPHQLSDNKFIKLLGETAENVPLAGGGSLRAKRREKFSAALAKQMDPDTDVTVLDDAAFKQLQDAAGERIGEISSKYQMPIEDFGDLNALARRDTPDVQAVVKTFADDLAQIAADNGGVIPGDTLRKLRTEAQSRARNVRGAKPDLANALDDVVHRFDDALTNNAAEADVTALANARRQYAISKTLEPLVAKHPDGSFPPSSLKGVVTSTKEGKRRMARGEGGDLGEYARVGQDLLKEQVSSGTAERNTIYSALGIGAGAGAAFTSLPAAAALYAGSALYNLLGPRVVKRMIEAEKRRNAPKPEGPPPEPTLGQGFEDVPQGAAPARANPLGDLTPDWETAPGAGAPREGGVDPAGMVRAVDETEALPQGVPQRPGSQIPLAESRPLGDLTPDWETSPGAGGPARAGAEPGLVPAVGEAPPTTGPRAALTERAGQQIPAVPGRPDLPDTLVAGGPAEVAATDASNAAMGTPGAIEARRQQGMARVEQAAAAERAEPVPVGEATEIRPQEVKPAPEMREPPPEKIPVGEATEIKPEVVKPAPEIPDHPEVAKVKDAILKKRDAEAKKQSAADELRKAAEVETDPEVKAALLERAEKVAPKKEKTDVAKPPKAADEESLSIDLSAPGQDVDRAWRDLTGQNKFADFDNPSEIQATGNLGDFTLSQTKGKQWVSLMVREMKREGAYSAALEVGTEGFPTRTGVATTMYLQALNVAKQRGLGWTSEGIRSDAALAIYQRLKEAGVPFKREGGVDVIDAAALAKTDLAEVAKKLETRNRTKNPTASLDLALPNLDEAFLDNQLRAKAKAAPPPPPTARGRRQSRRAIEDGIADGSLDKEGGALALWALDKNPNLARGLRVEVETPANAQAKGSYNSASEIVKLFKGQTNPQTAIHEILHHSERLMPEPVQQGIRRAWERATKDLMAKATPERRAAMEAMDKASGGDADALQTVKDAFKNGVLTKEDYQFVNPTEYWAVNGARILHERFTGRGSWRAQAKQWMKEMIEQVKGIAGIKSDAAILKALGEVLDPKTVTGERKSGTMIKSFVGPVPK
jgi:hypothetical protein